MNTRRNRGSFFTLHGDGALMKAVRSALALAGFDVSDGTGDFLVTTEENALIEIEENKSVAGVIVLSSASDYPSGAVHKRLSESFRSSYRYLIRPFLLSELYEAADVISSPQSTYSDTEEVYLEGKILYYRGSEIKLTEREAELLAYLLSRRGEPVSRTDIAENVWKSGETDSNVTDVYISYLRKKLTPVLGNGAIIAVRGKGYMLSV